MNFDIDVLNVKANLFFDSNLQQEMIAFNFVAQIPLVSLLDKILAHGDLARNSNFAWSKSIPQSTSTPVSQSSSSLSQSSTVAPASREASSTVFHRSPPVPSPAFGQASGSGDFSSGNFSSEESTANIMQQTGSSSPPILRSPLRRDEAQHNQSFTGSKHVRTPIPQNRKVVMSGDVRADTFTHSQSSTVERISRPPSGSGQPLSSFNDCSQSLSPVCPKASSFVPSGMQNSALRMLFDAVKKNNGTQVAQALEMKADINAVDVTQKGQTCLQRAIWSGGHRNVVALLLRNLADPNLQNVSGRTSLHLAIERYQHMSGSVPRLLLSHNADTRIKDSNGRTPVDYVNDIVADFRKNQMSSISTRAKMKVMQLYQEFLLKPTLATYVDEGDVLGAAFANQEGTFCMFYTEWLVTIYNVHEKRVLSRWRLSQKLHGHIHCVALNEVTGAIAVYIDQEAAAGRSMRPVGQQRSVIFIWSSWSRIQESQPTKLEVFLKAPTTMSRAMMAVSQEAERPKLLVRSQDGTVVCWEFARGCLQVQSEHVLCDFGTSIAISSDGRLAVVGICQDGAEAMDLRIEVWDVSKLSMEEPWLLKVITCNKPCMGIRGLAVAHWGGHNRALEGHIAIVPKDTAVNEEPCGSNDNSDSSPQEGEPIQVWSISEQNEVKISAKIHLDARCRSLVFRPTQPEFMCVSLEDGQIITFNLITGEKWFICDDMAVSSIAISSTGSLGASCTGNFVRIFRMADKFTYPVSEEAEDTLVPGGSRSAINLSAIEV